MSIKGTIKNGVIVPNGELPWPEGSEVYLDPVEEGVLPDLSLEERKALPPDHPMAPYNREREAAILRESVSEAEAGYPGRPLQEVLVELTLKYGLPPLPSDRS